MFSSVVVQRVLDWKCHQTEQSYVCIDRHWCGDDGEDDSDEGDRKKLSNEPDMTDLSNRRQISRFLKTPSSVITIAHITLIASFI